LVPAMPISFMTPIVTEWRCDAIELHN
jgi:hypothetical protein